MPLSAPTALALLVVAFAAPTGAAGAHEPTAQAAPGPPAMDTRHRHLGFFIRPELGLGHARTSATIQGTGATLEGRSGVAGIAIGGAIAENLILSGHIYVTTADNGSASASTSAVTGTNPRFTVSGIGPELDYYFMPQNVYVALTLAATEQWFTFRGREYRDSSGIGGELAVGKEWWVSDHWGLGVAGKLFASSNRDPTGLATSRWTAWGGAIYFSATYN